ncbi:uncharacterized protein ARB_01778 [Trichophyton benhamiae CBS 112371]|uniref:Uncharacterized protein n=1 Tax=Arthroderma benhamiae (strain ATCC MYA-4681 / CBS 112371) TaxID=663331 RepID=D4B007_ARTBC|nr:uncharacterized protein ARB_01778 [Trichophyton benhamiae CBS 112371]EFE31382.1 hypothetical protein ARB_01778 [Trichophyton benhamiae CBS 112371]
MNSEETVGAFSGVNKDKKEQDPSVGAKSESCDNIFYPILPISAELQQHLQVLNEVKTPSTTLYHHSAHDKPFKSYTNVLKISVISLLSP